jgi:hypothetical protein
MKFLNVLAYCLCRYPPEPIPSTAVSNADGAIPDEYVVAPEGASNPRYVERLEGQLWPERFEEDW